MEAYNNKMMLQQFLREDIVELGMVDFYVVSGQWTEEVSLQVRSLKEWGVKYLYLCK
jgi:SpoVK/Ycf46/Vps4 family AAA+-type ATPase